MIRLFHNPARTLVRAGYGLMILGVWLAPAYGASAAELWQSATKAYFEKKYALSASLLETLVSSHPESERREAARFFLAESYRLQARTDRALDLYRGLASGAKDASLRNSARFREAEAAFNQADYPRAEQLLGRLAGDSQAEFLMPQIRMAQVKTLLRRGQPDDAQKIFNELTRALPRSLLDPEVKFLYGILKEYEGRTIDALRIYEELAEHPLAKLFSGSILESQGRFLAAVEAYNQVLSARTLPEHRELALYSKARAFYKSGDFLSTERLCRDFALAFPHGNLAAPARLLFVLVRLAQARYPEVLAEIEQGKAGWKTLPASDQGLVDLAHAEALLNLGRAAESAAQFEKALGDADPVYRPQALLKAAYARLVAKEAGAAARWMNDYFRAVKDPEPLAHLLAVYVFLDAGKENLAFRSTQALADSGDALLDPALYHLAASFLDQRRYQSLTAQWIVLEAQANRRPPDPAYRETAAWTRLLVAEAFFRQAEYPAARRTYQQARDVYPYAPVSTHAQVGLIWCGFQLDAFDEVVAESDRLLASPAARDLGEAVAGEIALLRAQALFNLGRYPEAITSYRRWLDLPGLKIQAPGVWFEIGWAHYLNQSYLDAVETWEELAKRYPDAPEAAEALAWTADTYFQAGKNAEARALYQRLAEKTGDPEERAAYELRLAQTYYNERRDEEAIRAFGEIMRAYPGTGEAQEAENGVEAASYRIADRLDNITAFRSFIEQFPQSRLAEDIQYRIGEAYYQKERYAESLEQFSAFVLTYTKSPRTPSAQYYIIFSQEHLGNLEDAVKQAAAFLQNYPQHELAPEILFGLASNEFKLERYPEAAEHFAECGERFPLKDYRPRAWYNAAVTYEKIKAPELALQYYLRLIEGYPQDANTPVSLSRAVILQGLRGETARANDLLDRLAKLGDRELAQKTRLGLATIYQEQGEEDAQEKLLRANLEQGLTSTEEYGRGLVELAAVYEKRKSWKDALTVYRRLAATTKQPAWKDAATKRIQLLRKIVERSGR